MHSLSKDRFVFKRYTSQNEVDNPSSPPFRIVEEFVRSLPRLLLWDMVVESPAKELPASSMLFTRNYGKEDSGNSV